jgi:hypothetical protein
VRKQKKERKNYVGATSNRTSFSNTCCHNMTTSVRRSHKYQERSFSEHEGSWMCHPNTTTFLYNGACITHISLFFSFHSV